MTGRSIILSMWVCDCSKDCLRVIAPVRRSGKGQNKRERKANAKNRKARRAEKCGSEYERVLLQGLRTEGAGQHCG
jgi:hypothetical protein